MEDTLELRRGIGIEQLAYHCKNTSEEHGFWDIDKMDKEHLLIATKIGLCQSELAEALEAHRKGDDGHVGEELADACIRIFDLAEYLNIDLEMEIMAKMRTNETRPYKHNKRY
jgi:NTP pyrophosphatase (non-canonical NTP hydrolase)